MRILFTFSRAFSRFTFRSLALLNFRSILGFAFLHIFSQRSLTFARFVGTVFRSATPVAVIAGPNLRSALKGLCNLSLIDGSLAPNAHAKLQVAVADCLFLGRELPSLVRNVGLLCR